MSDLTPEQCRAARALLGWSQDQLKEASGVSKVTIADFERGARARSPYADTLAKLVDAFAVAGVEFIGAGDYQGGGGPGVRLKA